jgi:hypothetical protein
LLEECQKYQNNVIFRKKEEINHSFTNIADLLELVQCVGWIAGKGMLRVKIYTATKVSGWIIIVLPVLNARVSGWAPREKGRRDVITVAASVALAAVSIVTPQQQRRLRERREFGGGAARTPAQ